MSDDKGIGRMTTNDELRSAIAEIIDPHAFTPIRDDVEEPFRGMIEDDRKLALSRAGRISELLASRASAAVVSEGDVTDEMVGAALEAHGKRSVNAHHMRSALDAALRLYVPAADTRAMDIIKRAAAKLEPALSPAAQEKTEPVLTEWDEVEAVERMLGAIAKPFPSVGVSFQGSADTWRKVMKHALRLAHPEISRSLSILGGKPDAYRDCPEDIKLTAKSLVDSYSSDHEGLLEGGIAAALCDERFRLTHPSPPSISAGRDEGLEDEIDAAYEVAKQWSSMWPTREQVRELLSAAKGSRE